MRCSSEIAVTVVLAIALCAGPAFAQPKPGPQKTRQPIGTNPHPVIWTSTKPKPAPPSPPPKSPPPDRRCHDRGRCHPCGVRNNFYFFGDDFDYAYSYGYDPYGYPVVANLPMGPGFGPQAAVQFMDVNDANQAWANGAVAAPPQNFDDDPPEPKKALSRSTNAHSIETAWKSIGYGDTLFAKQRYAEASDRYRRASNTAPQLAEAWFRRGLALTATGRYDLAVNSIKRGLKIDPKWPKSASDAKDVLWTDAETKTAYFSELVETAAQNPNDPNVQFLVGVCFHVDGQEEQAKKYLSRAKRIAGNNTEHIEAFLVNAL